jgi:hypothetical protein
VLINHKVLLNTLALNQPLDDVAGITYAFNGAIKNNPAGQLIDLDASPIALPYDLARVRVSS